MLWYWLLSVILSLLGAWAVFKIGAKNIKTSDHDAEQNGHKQKHENEKSEIDK